MLKLLIFVGYCALLNALWTLEMSKQLWTYKYNVYSAVCASSSLWFGSTAEFVTPSNGIRHFRLSADWVGVGGHPTPTPHVPSCNNVVTALNCGWHFRTYHFRAAQSEVDLIIFYNKRRKHLKENSILFYKQQMQFNLFNLYIILEFDYKQKKGRRQLC